MGFGLSQVLPLIVQGLYAAPGSWLVVEQPEIHLNPRLQARLGDLVVALNERSVGVILETHSDHLLLRLRRLLAQDEIEDDDFGLYFVDRDGNKSRVREVSVDQTGYIDPERWPVDFFDDSLRESLALALAQAGRRRHQSTDGPQNETSSD
jgi:predicted ATPase